MATRVDLDGTYKLEFASNLNFRGSGLVTLSNGKFKGNDQSFEWRGTYEVKHEELHAEMHVKQFSGGISIFGVVSEFDLIVNGPVELPRMTLKGYRKEEPDDKFVVLMTRFQDSNELV
jgi:hypothetical protein